MVRGKPCNKLSKNEINPHMVFADRLQSGEVFYLKLTIKISVTHTSILEINHSLYSKAGVVVSEERLLAQNLCDSGVSNLPVLIEDGGRGMNSITFWLCFETKFGKD